MSGDLRTLYDLHKIQPVYLLHVPMPRSTDTIKSKGKGSTSLYPSCEPMTRRDAYWYHPAGATVGYVVTQQNPEKQGTN